MILRRIIDACESQNWTAVTLQQEYIHDAPDIMRLASSYMNVVYDSAHPLGYTIETWDTAAEDRALINAVNKVMGDQIAFNERRKIIL